MRDGRHGAAGSSGAVVSAPDRVFAIQFWASTVGDGAPGNAAGERSGYGLTKAEATARAAHWNNQAPWERLSRRELIDQKSGAAVSMADEYVVGRILPDESLLEFFDAATRTKIRTCWRLARDGKIASAVHLYWATPDSIDADYCRAVANGREPEVRS